VVQGLVHPGLPCNSAFSLGHVEEPRGDASRPRDDDGASSPAPQR
jgi:hypothetical protein